MNKLEQLKAVTTVVADTGEIEAIRRYAPVDATTNPSLLLKVAGNPDYRAYLDGAIDWSRQQGGSDREILANCIDRLAVSVGKDITGIVPGRVSTEVSARLSFNSEATVAKARKLIELYEQEGVARDRVLIKIASTWEGFARQRCLSAREFNVTSPCCSASPRRWPVPTPASS